MAIMRVAELRTSAYSFRPGGEAEEDSGVWRFASVGLSRELDAKALLFARLVTERLEGMAVDGTAAA